MTTADSRQFTCVTCGFEMVGEPTMRLGLAFCCPGCAGDGPCTCTYDHEPNVPSNVRHCLDVADPIDPSELARADFFRATVMATAPTRRRQARTARSRRATKVDLTPSPTA